MVALLVGLAILGVGIYFYTRTEVTPTIVVVSPSNGATLMAGSPYQIVWQTESIPDDYLVSVVLRRISPPPSEEGQDFDPVLFTNLANTGVVEWIPPSSLIDGTYVIEVNGYESLPMTNPVLGTSEPFRIEQERLIGGDTDDHGCLIGAGYSWCEARNECIRPWETYCTATPGKTVTFICTDEKTIQATFYIGDDQFVDLVLSDDRAMSIPRAISASGARYAKEDESFVFWNKGDTAFITEDGVETYTTCTLANTE